LCIGGICLANASCYRSFLNRVNRDKTQDAGVRRVSFHKCGHEKTYEWEYVWQRYRRSYSIFRIKVVFVFADGKQVLVVVLWFALSVFLSFRAALAFCFALCVSKKLCRDRMRHRHVFDFGPLNHFRPLVADTRLFVVRTT
jgi:hypothetical protein